MIVYTVLRHVKDKTFPLHSFDSLEKAQEWAEVQMQFLDKDYFYSIAMWDTNFSTIMPCKDKRLRLVK
jgi:hypothetical protein